MMGFRNHDGTAITYGKGENCYTLDGHHHGEHESHKDVRYKYSPTHSDPAVCCVPNYTRNFPYFLDQMWQKTPEGLMAVMYGLSVMETVIAGSRVEIEQLTQYPFSDELQFNISIDQPATFELSFRKPGWVKRMSVFPEDAIVFEGEGVVRLKKECQSGDLIDIKFEQAPERKQFADGEMYMQRGPLVYAYSIPHKTLPIKQYVGTSFKDYHCLPVNESYAEAKLPTTDEWEYFPGERVADRNPWYAHPTKLKSGELELVPLGSTVLRKLTFKVGGS